MIPKSPTIPIGENRLAKRLAIVVTAVSDRGTVTFARPLRTASTTGLPSVRCSRQRYTICKASSTVRPITVMGTIAVSELGDLSGPKRSVPANLPLRQSR